MAIPGRPRRGARREARRCSRMADAKARKCAEMPLALVSCSHGRRSHVSIWAPAGTARCLGCSRRAL
eukprot:7983546-Alexandrium_andersonii.AAC.1